MDDTHIMKSVPTTNYYGATVMYMGRWASYPARIMMQFVFTDALKNAIAPSSITEAKLYLWDQSTDTTRRTVNVRIPRNIWTASTVTWNTAPSYYTGTWNGIPAPTSHTISGDPGWWAFPYMKDVVAAMLRNYIDTSLAQTIHEKRGIMIKLADETVGLKTLRSSNHSENRPNMSITYTPTSGGSVGAYGPYWSIGSSHADLENVNCWGYAMKKTVFFQPTTVYSISPNILVEFIRDFVIEQTSAHRAIRQLSSINSSINNNAEWRIACRFNSKLSGIGTDGYLITNYHFVVQNSNGSWSHKNGRSPSQVLSASPETNASGCWDEIHSTNYHALYFALS